MNETSQPPIEVAPVSLREPAPSWPEYEPQPRLGIIHLMVWMLTSGVLLAVGRMFDDPLPLPQSVRIWMQLHLGVQAILGGMALGGLLIWLRRLMGGGPRFPASPGHWLLWLQGWVLISMWGFSGASFLLAQRVAFDEFLFHLVMYAAITGLSAVLTIPCLIASWRPLHWRAFYATFGITRLLLLAMEVPLLFQENRGNVMLVSSWSIMQPILFALPGLVLVVALIFDHRQRAPRDWLYWVAMIVWFGSLIPMLLFPAVSVSIDH